LIAGVVWRVWVCVFVHARQTTRVDEATPITGNGSRLFGDKRGGGPLANAHNETQKKGVIPRFSAVYRDQGTGARDRPARLSRCRHKTRCRRSPRPLHSRGVRCIHAQKHRLRMRAPSDLEWVGAIVGEMHAPARHRVQAVLPDRLERRTARGCGRQSSRAAAWVTRRSGRRCRRR
jgi:hypothetical protein